MKKIDITTTAVIRPDILDETFKTFNKYLFIKDRQRYRLFINIDPIGDPNKLIDMYDICHKYFDDVTVHTPIKPSFSKAVLWLWKRVCQTDSDFVFHLEDDWSLYKDIDINHMIKILNKYKDLACLRLYKHDIPNSKTPTMFGKKYDYHKEGFFISRDSSNQFGLNPVLVKKKFIEEAASLLKEDFNPEKQMRAVHPYMHDFIMKWKYGIYGNPGDKIFVWGKRGKHWREKQGFEKGKMNFTTWVKKGK